MSTLPVENLITIIARLVLLGSGGGLLTQGHWHGPFFSSEPQPRRSPKAE